MGSRRLLRAVCRPSQDSGAAGGDQGGSGDIRGTVPRWFLGGCPRAGSHYLFRGLGTWMPCPAFLSSDRTCWAAPASRKSVSGREPGKLRDTTVTACGGSATGMTGAARKTPVGGRGLGAPSRPQHLSRLRGPADGNSWTLGWGPGRWLFPWKLPGCTMVWVCCPRCLLKRTVWRVWGHADSRPQVRGSSVNPSLFDKDHRAATITQLLSKTGPRRDGPRTCSGTTTPSDRERVPEESGGRHLSLRGEASLARSGEACLCSDAVL